MSMTCFRIVMKSLDGPGIESWWGSRFFRTHPDRLWGPPSLLYNPYRVFPGGKTARRGIDHPSLSNAKVKDRLQLYIYSPSGLAWAVLG